MLVTRWRLCFSNRNLPSTAVFVEWDISMKKLFALLLFLMLPIAPIGAQGLQGRIVLVIPDGQTEPEIESLLPTIYSGEVDITSTLIYDSAALSIYDAILMFVPPNYGYPSDTLSITDELQLIGYVRNGGRLYAEAWRGSSADASLFLLKPSPNDTSQDPEDTLWHYLGLQAEFYEAIFDYYDTIEGIDSEFTRGLRIPQTFGESYEADAYSPFGNITSVLLGHISNGEPDDIFAWVPLDTSLHAVMHHPVLGNYYSDFLTHIICDYFGLCEDAVKEAPPAVLGATLRVVNNGTSTSLVVSSEGTGTLDVMNALGVAVYHSSVNSNTSRIELPVSLRNGVYFARLQTEHGGQVQPFAIVAK
jgi:hypothetical protein